MLSRLQQHALSVSYIPAPVSVAYIDSTWVLFEVRGHDRNILETFSDKAALVDWLTADYRIRLQLAEEEALRQASRHRSSARSIDLLKDLKL